jgi:hypothetical protein
MMQQNISAGRGSTSAQATQGKLGGIPGLWQAVAMVLLLAVIGGTWLASSVATTSQTPSANGLVAGALAQVDDEDIDGALTTLDGGPAFTAQFRQRADGCARPLAWVTLTRISAQTPAKIRLQSGSYVSPVFNVAEMPTRVAIPYPAPYETGRGSITAFDIGGDAVVELLPAWRVSERSTGITHQVVWHPNKRCQ